MSRLRTSSNARRVRGAAKLLHAALIFPRKSPEWYAQKYIASMDLDLVFDVGANVGQFATMLRASGYREDIVSFEPVSTTFDHLQVISKSDAKWRVVNCALGEEVGVAEINVSGNAGLSSSLLPMEERHLSAFPASRYTGSEQVEVRRLDEFFDGLGKPSQRIFIKVDAQGFEGEVLSGAHGILDRVVGVRLELSLTPLYQGGWTFKEALAWLDREGFEPRFFMEGVADAATGETLQIDVIGVRA